VALSSLYLTTSVLLEGGPGSNCTVQNGDQNETVFGVRSSILFHFVPLVASNMCSTMPERLPCLGRSRCEHDGGVRQEYELRSAPRSRRKDMGTGHVGLGFQEPEPGARAVGGARIAVTSASGRCSRSPCGVRARDESTKRKDMSLWGMVDRGLRPPGIVVRDLSFEAR
jgi:hypothetical protein